MCYNKENFVNLTTANLATASSVTTEFVTAKLATANLATTKLETADPQNFVKLMFNSHSIPQIGPTFLIISLAVGF